MTDFPRIEEKLLSERVKDIIFKMMKDGAFDETGHLPPEIEVANKLNVSRTVIRDVYSLLENEGYITRRRGIGTIINFNVLQVKVRLDIDHENEFYDLVSEAGHIPKTSYIDYKKIKVTDELSESLKIDSSQKVIMIDRLITADDIPVIYCRNYFPEKSLKKSMENVSDINIPIFNLLNEFCDIKIHQEIAKLKPLILDHDLMTKFQITESEPVLFLKEIAYDINQNPVLFSEEYHRTGILNHTILRKKV